MSSAEGFLQLLVEKVVGLVLTFKLKEGLVVSGRFLHHLGTFSVSFNDVFSVI